MIDWQLVSSPRSDPLYLVVADERDMDDSTYVAMQGHAGALIRLIRGARCKRDSGVFQEFAAALQFPYYFGHNWDAFDECINDLSWVQFESCTLVLTNVDQILEGSDEAFGILMQLLTKAATEWAVAGRASPRTRSPRVFRSILHTRPDTESSLTSRLATLSIDVARFGDDEP